MHTRKSCLHRDAHQIKTDYPFLCVSGSHQIPLMSLYIQLQRQVKVRSSPALVEHDHKWIQEDSLSILALSAFISYRCKKQLSPTEEKNITQKLEQAFQNYQMALNILERPEGGGDSADTYKALELLQRSLQAGISAVTADASMYKPRSYFKADRNQKRDNHCKEWILGILEIALEGIAARP